MGKLSRALVLVAAMVGLAALLSGCITSDRAMLTSDTATVTARGGVQWSMADIERQLYVEAATMTLEHGYVYFEVLESDVGTREQLYSSGTGFGSVSKPQGRMRFKMLASKGAARSANVYGADEILALHKKP